MPDRGPWRAIALGAFVWLCADAVAQNSKPTEPAADADLLEFLGSVDSGADSQTSADDGSWIEYLAQTDIGKVAKASEPKDRPPRKPADGEEAASGDKKND